MARAAQLSTPALSGSVLSALARPFRLFGEFLIALGERSPYMSEVNRLNARSDEDLARNGLTREGEIRRIFANRFYI